MYRVSLVLCILIIQLFISFNIAYSQNANQKAKTEDELANELANPSSSLAILGVNLQYINFKGDLPGADSQEGWNLLFQPIIPYPFESGWNLLSRPANQYFLANLLLILVIINLRIKTGNLEILDTIW